MADSSEQILAFMRKCEETQGGFKVRRIIWPALALVVLAIAVGTGFLANQNQDDRASAQQATPTATATPTPTSTLTPTPTATATPTLSPTSTTTPVQVTGTGQVGTFTPPLIPSGIGYLRQYEPTGVGNTFTRTISDLPSGKTLVIGGYTVKYGGKQLTNGWYLVADGPLKDVVFTITDGFYAIVDTQFGERETCKRLADARLAGWAMSNVPWPNWETRCQKYQ